MCNRKSVLAACGALVLVTMGAAASHAWNEGGEMEVLTFSRPVGLPGVTLPAGSYVFERAHRTVVNLVRVSSKDRKTVYLTAFTLEVPRPAGLRADARVTFGEAERGAAPPISAWYPTGVSVGRRFIYDAR